MTMTTFMEYGESDIDDVVDRLLSILASRCLFVAAHAHARLMLAIEERRARR